MCQIAFPLNLLKQVSKKSIVWRTIAADMQAMGYHRDSAACSIKYRALVSQYKVCKDLNKRSGNSKITFQQMSTMDEILGESESTEPQFLFSMGTTTSADKNVLLTGTEIATLSTLKKTNNN